MNSKSLGPRVVGHHCPGMKAQSYLRKRTVDAMQPSLRRNQFTVERMYNEPSSAHSMHLAGQENLIAVCSTTSMTISLPPQSSRPGAFRHMTQHKRGVPRCNAAKREVQVVMRETKDDQNPTPGPFYAPASAACLPCLACSASLASRPPHLSQEDNVSFQSNAGGRKGGKIM